MLPSLWVYIASIGKCLIKAVDLDEAAQRSYCVVTYIGAQDITFTLLCCPSGHTQ